MKTRQEKGTMVTVIEMRSQKDGEKYYACYRGDMRPTFQSKAPCTLFIAGADSRWHKIEGRAPEAYSEEKDLKTHQAGAYMQEARVTDLNVWREDAACLDADLDIFFPDIEMTKTEREEAIKNAKELCASCPVQKECLAHAISRPERYGTWGGLTEKERKEL